jgi:hypothetical protein
MYLIKLTPADKMAETMIPDKIWLLEKSPELDEARYLKKAFQKKAPTIV